MKKSSQTNMSLFTCTFQVKNLSGSLSLKLRDAQLNCETLGKFFNLFPQTIFLVAEDGTVATPDNQGEFDTYDVDPNLVWTINGDPTKPDLTAMQPAAKPGTSYAYQQQTIEAKASQKNKWKPHYSTLQASGSGLHRSGNKPPGATKHCNQEHSASGKKPGRQPGETWTKTIDICTWDDSTIKKTFNLPITLSEKGSDATVGGVAALVATEAFDGEEVVLLDADNLLIPDSCGTRGTVCVCVCARVCVFIHAVECMHVVTIVLILILLCRCKKVKAMRRVEYTASGGSGKKKLTNYFSDSDLSDFELPAPKKIDLTVDEDTGTKDTPDNVPTNPGPLNDVCYRLEKCIDKVSDLQVLREQVSVLQGDKEKFEREAALMKQVIEELKDGLTCIICKSVASFPWILTPCCRIITCKECSDRWLEMDSSCPHCRAVVETSTCMKVPHIRAVEDIINTWRRPSE